MQALSHRWSVQVCRVVETPSSLVAYALRGDQRVVLKAVCGQHEEWEAGAVVAAFNGHGVVRALEHLPGAVLLEQIQPGTRLTELVLDGRDHEATDVVAQVIAAMSAVTPNVCGFASAAQWAAPFARFLAGSRGLLPEDLVTTAYDLYLELCDTQDVTRLLHGDLQHENILLDRHQGWVAIDPKGVVAELEFELGAVLRNPSGLPDLFTPAAIARRADQLAQALELNVDRILGWAFGQAVLSAIWSFEDEGHLDRNAPILGFAHAVRSLVVSHRDEGRRRGA